MAHELHAARRNPRSRVGWRRSETTRLILGGVALIALCVVGAAAIRALGNGPLPMDVAWHDFVNLHRTPWLSSASLWLNDAGSQTYLRTMVPTLLAFIFLSIERPMLAVTAIIGGLIGAPSVALVKTLLERPRPDDGQINVTLSSYPSGHVSNLLVLLVIVGLIIARPWFWAIVVAATAAMAFSRTYLDVHWLTDTTGAVFLGAGLALVLTGVALGIEKRMTLATDPRRVALGDGRPLPQAHPVFGR